MRHSQVYYAFYYLPAEILIQKMLYANKSLV